jgi:hypothetical protein
VVDAVAGVEEALGKELARRFVPEGKQKEERGEEALRAEQKQTNGLLDAVKDVKDARVRDRAELLRSMLAEKDRPVSFEDPDARWGCKREDFAFLGYKTHEAIDPESRMITSVDVLPGNANEAVHTDELVKQEKSVVAGGATVIGDGLYNNVTTVAQVEASGGQACFSGRHAQRISDEFSYELDHAQGRGAHPRREERTAGAGQRGCRGMAPVGRRGRCPRRGERIAGREARGEVTRDRRSPGGSAVWTAHAPPSGRRRAAGARRMLPPREGGARREPRLPGRPRREPRGAHE